MFARLSKTIAYIFLTTILLVASSAHAAEPTQTTLTIHTDKVANTISPFIYGHFFEHIYNGGDNGIWGEMVWNRSFEYLGDDQGWWKIKDGIVTETAMAQGAHLMFGDSSWSNYEFTVKARKLGGNEGFLIVVRGTDDSWFWVNLGGWNNTGHQLLHVGQDAPIGRRIPGSIETNRWYDIRVRVEGRHIQSFLDGKQILDDTIDEELNGTGGVGIGTWMTTAEFKDFKVTDLDGKVLYQQTPDLPQNMAAAGEHWNIFGPGEVHVTDQGAYNDQYAIQIKNTSGDVGVSQSEMCLKKGETYKGSLFLKGSAPDGAKVRFKNGPTTVAEVSIPAPTSEWKEYPFQFTSGQDAPDANMQIAFTGKVDAMLDQVSLMSQSTIANDGFRPDIYGAFAGLKPTIIRWPGGVYAEQYHWKNGIGPQSQRKKSITPLWNDYDPNSLGTDEYMTLCRKLGAEPLLVINTGLHVTGGRNADEWKPWIEEACDWVEYCNGPADSTWGKVRAANGHPEPYHVKYWEIDNELWRSLQPNPAVYARAVPLFAEAMKKIDPSITIIAHGGNDADRNYDRRLLNDAATSFNILSIHHYAEPQRFVSNIAAQDSLYHDLIEMIKSSKNPDIKLDVSEWNAQTIDWRTGLYAGALLNTFEKYGANVVIAGPALLFRHTSAPAWDNAFINFNHKGYFTAPNYVVMKLWREHFAPERLAVDGDAGQLNLIATRDESAGKVILKAVNETNAAIAVSATLDGAGFAPSAADFALIAPGGLGARNSMTQPDVVKPVASNATIDKQTIHFTMPAYSAGAITITKAK